MFAAWLAVPFAPAREVRVFAMAASLPCRHAVPAEGNENSRAGFLAGPFFCKAVMPGLVPGIHAVVRTLKLEVSTDKKGMHTDEHR
jgi:hypothetical protein